MLTDSIDYFREHQLLYNLMLKGKDSEVPDEIEAMQEVLENLGFWSPSESLSGKYLAPYKSNHKSFLLRAPNNWSFGEFPTPGKYLFVKVWQDSSKGERSWSMQVRNFELGPDKICYPTGRSIFLFCFLEGSEILRQSTLNLSVSRFADKTPIAGTTEFDEMMDWNNKVDKIRLECVEMAPELSHYTWPKILHFCGPWEEKDLADPDFFQKTLALITGEFVPDVRNDLSFKSLEWNNGIASLTTMIKYHIRDEHTWREYGIDKKREETKEIGIWLRIEDSAIAFDCIQIAGSHWFFEYSGKLLSQEIQLFLECPSRKKDKDFMLNYFSKFGIHPTNLPDYENQN